MLLCFVFFCCVLFLGVVVFVVFEFWEQFLCFYFGINRMEIGVLNKTPVLSVSVINFILNKQTQIKGAVL